MNEKEVTREFEVSILKSRWQPNPDRAEMWKNTVGRSPYRWVIMAVWFLMMTLNSVSLTSYPLALLSIAQEFKITPGTFDYYAGILSYSLGLFIIYFANIKSWMNLRVRLAIILAQAFMIIPSFLLPLASSYSTIVLLRFIQGLWFIELGLSTVHLKGWFNKSELSLALAAPLSALVIGSAVGGLIEKVLVETTNWRIGTYVTAGAVTIATLISSYSTAMQKDIEIFSTECPESSYYT
jgi:MFS family permease